ncbi:hypothetical protein AALP_AA2G083000 [Arabis alpina]|uniref:Uncharacterized protein n=1 Tax=Arabis alpina TaxID=50452 RepID=A0A087HG29_ARAAL|nr:hypothetical protein AALP_AA2G083000 [Arabis alpina]
MSNIPSIDPRLFLLRRLDRPPLDRRSRTRPTVGPRMLVPEATRRDLTPPIESRLMRMTHGSIRAVMVVVVLAAERGGVVNIDEFEEISSFSPTGNTGSFYISPRVEPVKRKTPKDSVITLLRKDKGHIRHWPDFLSYRIDRSYPRVFVSDFYIPLEDHSPEPPSDSNKKKDSSHKKKDLTPLKKKSEPVRSQAREAPVVKFNLDVVDSDEELELPEAAPVVETEGLRPEKAPINHGRGKGTMTGGLFADSRRAEAARLEREKQKEALRRTQKEEEKRKKGEAEAKKKKRPEEERRTTKPALEKKRSAQEALGSGDRVEKMLAGYNFLSDAWYASDQKNRNLNTQNGELVSESNRSKEARCKAEQEVTKLKDLLNHSEQMNGDLIAKEDVLNSKVAALTSALAEAEEIKKKEMSRVEDEVAELKSSSKDAVARAVGEAKRRAKDKLRRSLEIMEERSRAQTEVDRLASLANQVVGTIRRMDKAAKDEAPIDAAKKEKLKARLVTCNAEADKIVHPPLPVDSSDDEEVEPRRNVALDISLSDSSDDEAERTEVEGVAEPDGAEKAVATDATYAADVADVADAVDGATGEPIAPLFSQPDANLEEREPEVAS